MTFQQEMPTVETWPAIHKLLAPAIRHGGDTTAEQVIDDLLAHQAQLWVKWEGGEPVAACVSTVHTDQTMHCQLLGGRNMASWIEELTKTVTEKARPYGIHTFTMQGRPGFERVLKNRGWKKRQVVMDYPLESERGLV